MVNISNDIQSVSGASLLATGQAGRGADAAAQRGQTKTTTQRIMAVVCSGLLSMSLCACGEPNVQRRDTSAVSTGSNEADADGQKRAETAGRELLGTPAPALSFKTIDGKRVDLATFYGRRPVYLKFWATWCVPCRQQMPAFEADYARFGGRIETFAVNTGFNDDLAAVRAYRTELALAMPIAIDDGRLARAFNLRVTPQHVVVGRDGRRYSKQRIDLMVTANPVPADEIPWVPLREGLAMRPLCFLDDGYSLHLRLDPETVIGLHRHTGEVDAINLSGARRIFTTQEVLGPGTFVHEPAGNADSWGCEGDQQCVVQITLKGRVEYLNVDGNVDHYTDTHTAQEAYLAHCNDFGIAPDNRLFRGAGSRPSFA